MYRPAPRSLEVAVSEDLTELLGDPCPSLPHRVLVLSLRLYGGSLRPVTCTWKATCSPRGVAHLCEPLRVVASEHRAGGTVAEAAATVIATTPKSSFSGGGGTPLNRSRYGHILSPSGKNHRSGMRSVSPALSRTSVVSFADDTPKAAPLLRCTPSPVHLQQPLVGTSTPTALVVPPVKLQPGLFQPARGSGQQQPRLLTLLCGMVVDTLDPMNVVRTSVVAPCCFRFTDNLTPFRPT